MADPLYELLLPYFDSQDASVRPSPSDPITAAYLSRLTTLPLAALTTSEQQSLSQTSHSIHRSLQALSKRSHRPIISSSDHLSHLRTTLPHLAHHASTIASELPALDTAAQKFASKYSKTQSADTAENPLLARRRKSMLLSRNIDRVTSMLDLPTLLSTAISSTTAPSQATAQSASSGTANYASALDLHAHIKRLHILYPHSALVSSLAAQAEQEMKTMTSNLIAGLQAPGLKLAGAMRTIGWLRRVAPELDDTSLRGTGAGIGTGEGALGALFLVCRLAGLMGMLEALEPLRELADQELVKRTEARKSGNGKVEKSNGADAWKGGQQTERYLKRYIEIFREQSFAIISMYKSIFPSALPFPESGNTTTTTSPPTTSPPSILSPKSPPSATSSSESPNPLLPLPSPLSTFPQHLTSLLFSTLSTYLPNITERSSRDSLLTQVLYCAGSLGRLGADFSLLIASLEGGDLLDDEEGEKDLLDEDVGDGGWEWVEVIKKHRVQAGRLELLASGVGTGGGRERVTGMAG